MGLPDETPEMERASARLREEMDALDAELRTASLSGNVEAAQAVQLRILCSLAKETCARYLGLLDKLKSLPVGRGNAELARLSFIVGTLRGTVTRVESLAKLPAWDQSDGVVCPTCGGDFTLCEHGNELCTESGNGCATACIRCGAQVPDLGPLKTPYVCDDCKGLR
jgi:hypothetical protein